MTTHAEERRARAEALALVTTRVVATRELNDELREITIGPLPQFVSLGGDQVITLGVEAPGRPIPADMRLGTYRDLPEDRRPLVANYTVRRWHPETETIDLWIVLHGHADTVSAWVRDVEPGDRLRFWGPRGAYTVPPGTTRLLLLGDESAFAAIGAIIDETDPALPIHVIAETRDQAHEIELATRGDVTVDWRHRGRAGPGASGCLLDAVRGHDVDDDGLFVFGAAESHEISAVRAHLRDERCLPAARVSLTGYWRRTVDDTHRNQP